MRFVLVNFWHEHVANSVSYNHSSMFFFFNFEMQCCQQKLSKLSFSANLRLTALLNVKCAIGKFINLHLSFDANIILEL